VKWKLELKLYSAGLWGQGLYVKHPSLSNIWYGKYVANYGCLINSINILKCINARPIPGR
jgi:hypothetical protein